MSRLVTASLVVAFLLPGCSETEEEKQAMRKKVLVFTKFMKSAEEARIKRRFPGGGFKGNPGGGFPGGRFGDNEDDNEVEEPVPFQPIDAKTERVFDSGDHKKWIGLLSHANPAVRHKAAEKLRYRWYDEVVEAAVDRFKKENSPKVKRQLVRVIYSGLGDVLGEVKESAPNTPLIDKVVATLALAIADEDTRVVGAAGSALSRLKQRAAKARDAVARTLASKYMDARAAAAEAFYYIGPERSPTTISHLRKILDNDTSGWLGGAPWAARCLGQLGDLEYLLQTLSDNRHAATGLAEIHPTNARIISALTKAAKEQHFQQTKCIHALANAHPTPESVVDTLAGLLKHEEPSVRSEAADGFALIEPKHKKAVPILLANAKHSDRTVQEKIAKALAGYPAAGTQLLQATLVNLISTDLRIRQGAAEGAAKNANELLPAVEKILFDPKAKPEERAGAIVFIHENASEAKSTVPKRFKTLVQDDKQPLIVRGWAACCLPYQDKDIADRAEVLRLVLKSKSHPRLVKRVLGVIKHKRDQIALELIIAALKDQRKTGDFLKNIVSQAAADALSKYDDQKAAAALIDVVNQESHPARGEAVEALAYQLHSAKKAYNTMLAGLGDKNSDVQEAAASGIHALHRRLAEWKKDNPEKSLPGEKVDFTSCVKPLRKVLAKRDKNVSASVVRALVVAGPAAADAIADLQWAVSQRFKKNAVCEVAAAIGPKAEPLVPELIKIADGPGGWDSDDAIQALGSIGKPVDTIRPKLLGYLAIPRKSGVAATALVALGDEARPLRSKIAILLADPQTKVRAQAARVLASLGTGAKDTAPQLLAAMKAATTDDEFRWLTEAIVNVNGVTDNTTADAFAIAIGHEDGRYYAVDQMEKHIQLASAVLSRALQSATPEVQTSALELIEEFRDKKGFSLDSAAIKQALNSKNEKVRAAAAAFLANSGDEPQLVIPIVVASIGKVEEDDLWRAQRPITRIGRPAVPALIAAIANPKNTLEHRRRLMLVLKDMGSYAHRAQPELRKIVAEEKDPTLKHLAAIILAKLTGDSKYVDLLLAAMETKGDDRKSSRMRRDAAWAMGNIKLPVTAIDALIAKLETDESDYSHTTALRDQTFSRAHIAKLLAGWEKSETGRKKINVLAGMENKPKEVIEALLKAIRSEHEDVASSAASALSSQPGITDAVFEIIGDEKATAETRKAALAALDYDFKPGKKHDAKLLPLLKHKDRDLAARAARLLVRAKRFPDSEIPGLVDSLLDSRARYRARNLLAELGEKVKPQLPQLHKLFAGEDDRVSNAALQVLSKLEEPAKLVPKVVARMKTKPDRYERESLADYLSYGGKSVAPEILKHVASEKDASIRIALLKSLEEQSAMPTDSADAVAKLVADKDMLVSTYAAMLMTHLDTESRKTHAKTMIEKLASALIAKDAEGAKQKIPRYGVGMALFRMGTLAAPAVPVLTKALDNKEQRSSALAALGRIGEPAKSAIPKMLELLAGKDASYEVVNALNSFDKKTLEPHKAKLVAALTSLLRKNKVVSSSVLLLGKLDASGDAAKALSELLKDGFYDVEAVRGMANLGAHAGKEVTDRVLAIVGSEDSPVDLRGEAIAALPSLGLRQAASADLLKIVAGDEPYLLRMAARGLGTGRDAKTVVPALTKLLAHKDDNVRSAALYSLSSFGKEAAPATKQVVTLIANRRTRYPAFRCLESIGPAAVDAVPGLTKALGDPAYRHYREQIVRSLRAIGKAAKPAVPELLKLVDPTNTGKPGDFEESVIEAIYEIDAEAAKKAGLPDPKSKK